MSTAQRTRFATRFAGFLISAENGRPFPVAMERQFPTQLESVGWSLHAHMRRSGAPSLDPLLVTLWTADPQK